MVVGKGKKCANNATYYLNVPIMRNLKQGSLFKDLFYRIVSRETKKCHKNYLDGRLDESPILHRPKKVFHPLWVAANLDGILIEQTFFFSSKQFRFRTTNEYFFEQDFDLYWSLFLFPFALTQIVKSLNWQFILKLGEGLKVYC